MDVATSVTKYVPNFCSVYVIAKGKLSTFRPATQANEIDTSKEDMESDAPGDQHLGAKGLCFSDTCFIDAHHFLSLVGYSSFTHEAHV